MIFFFNFRYLHYTFSFLAGISQNLYSWLHFTPGSASCYCADGLYSFIRVNLFFVLHWLHPVFSNTQCIHSYKCIHTLLWILIHFLAICPGDLPWGCWAVALTLFLFPFLCCILFKTKMLQKWATFQHFFINNQLLHQRSLSFTKLLIKDTTDLQPSFQKYFKKGGWCVKRK